MSTLKRQIFFFLDKMIVESSQKSKILFFTYYFCEFTGFKGGK